MKKKRCSTCGVEKDLSEFFAHKGHKDGYQGQCKDCRKAYCEKNRDHLSIMRKKYYGKNKERMCEYQKVYRKKNEDRIKERDKKFRENNKPLLKRRSKAYYDNNKDYFRNYSKEYRERNKDYMKKYQSDYRRTPEGKAVCARKYHKRRVHAKNVEISLTAEQWFYILENQNNRCNICDKKFTTKRRPTQDHIIPAMHNGDHSSNNVQALCQSCNSSKGGKLDKQYIQSWALIES